MSSLVGILLCGSLHAAVLISDRADNPPYQDGWQAGDNGGSGMGPWQQPFSGVGTVVGSATANGGSNPNTIDTSGVSWGLKPSTYFTRTITAPVGVGDILTLFYDPGVRVGTYSFVNIGGTSESATFYAGIDGNQYAFATGSSGGRQGTGITPSGDGVVLKFTILEAGNSGLGIDGKVRMSVTPIGGTEVSRELKWFGSQITSLAFGGGIAGSDPDVYINSIQAVVPEPAHVAAAVGAGLLVLVAVRRKVGARNTTA